MAQPCTQRYSVWNECTRGANTSLRVARSTEERRVSWLNLVLKLHTAHVLQNQAAGRSQHFFRANLDRKRQIWPADWCGLHYVRHHG